MENQVANSIAEFVQIVLDGEKECVRNGADKNEVLLFRGQPQLKLPLLPSLGRNRHMVCDISIFNQERNLIEMAKFKLPQVFTNDLQPIELLALLQHHGIPTRLLDVTENALVALFFACVSCQSDDGEVFLFKDNELDITNYPVLNGIAESYKFTRGTWTDLSSFYSDIKEQPYFLEQKQTNKICHKTDEKGGEWIEQCCRCPLFIYAPMKTLRQRIQQGRYILFPNKIEKDESSKTSQFVWELEEISRTSSCIQKIVTIPKDKKKTILDNLKVFGISKETLFCDNIDTVCESIVNMYTN